MEEKPKNPHRGSSFEDFLKEQGIFEECTARALKKVRAWQLKVEKDLIIENNERGNDGQ